MLTLWMILRSRGAARLRFLRRTTLAGALVGAALSLSSCSDPLGPLAREGVPDKLEFSIGGFGVGWSTVELRGDTVVLRRIPWDWDPSSAIDSVRAVPSLEAWRAFWTAAERAGVHRWRRRYVAEGVVDGGGWHLRLETQGKRIESEGSNAYPDRLGREHELEMPSDFRAFLEAVGELVNRPLVAGEVHRPGSLVVGRGASSGGDHVDKRMPVTIAKVNIVARKYDQTVEFYRRLGLRIPKVLSEPPEPRHAEAADHGSSSFAIDNPALARIYNADWRRPGPSSSVLLTAQMPTREAVDTIFDALVAAGHEGLQMPYDAFWGARYAVVRDPEGNAVGLESSQDEGKRSWPPTPSPDA